MNSQKLNLCCPFAREADPWHQRVTSKLHVTGALLEKLIRSQTGLKVSLSVHLQQSQRDLAVVQT